MRLQGKTAIVTGGAQGLGRCVSLLFAREGASVVVVDVAAAEAERVAAEIEAEGGFARSVPCDITKEDQIRETVSVVQDEFGGVDVLVNNAGVNPYPDTLADIGDEDWDRVFDVNTKAVFLFCRHVVPGMVERGRGSIVNISSVGAIFGSGGGHTYRSSKAALLSLTRTLAIELAASNVRVNCLCPGAMDTPMRHIAARDRAVTDPSSVPLGRIADPMEMAYCVLFLACDESSYVTGATLIADGGRSVM